MSDTYEPTIAQALFGAAHGPVNAPDYVSEDLYRLSEILCRRNPEAQSHGLFGGSFGYGQEFANDIFEMFPYWWGDCTCGYDEREDRWHDENSHAADCYQTALALLRHEKDVALGYDRPGPALVTANEETIAGITVAVLVSPHAPVSRRAHAKARATYDAKVKALCESRGLTYPESSECHCGCDYEARFVAWSVTNPSDPRCPNVRPNFAHKASGLEVRWYKYIGRGVSLNRPTTPEEWAGIVSECVASVAS